MACNVTRQRAMDLPGSDTLSEVSEAGTANSGWTSGGWDSREDLQDFVAKIGLKDVADLYQDRFRVDRKKLEQMLSGDNEAPLPADVFFEQVMEDTNTYIRWPSKLKVGAKSKKDPHVRIAGRPEDVMVAKERIMSILDTRSNRVTMKMDVSYTDHSHIIGKGGLSIKRIMEETHCHVHFPDSNRSNPTEKSNQVSIAGDIQGVELARSRVRQKTPVLFGFELPVMSQNVDATCPYIIKIQEQYGVQVMFRTRPKLHAILLLVKGVEWEIEQVKRATLSLVEYLCENLANQIPIQMTMEISPHHHPTVIGKNHSNLREIMRLTNAQIMFCDAHDPNIPNLKKSNVVITGNIHNVYAARQLLIGSLPLVVMFDLPENYASLPTRPDQISQIQTKYDVTVSIRMKAKQSIMACIVKGTERAASSIYQARNEILGIDEHAIVADIPNNYHTSQYQSIVQELPTPTPINPQPILSPLIRPAWHYPQQPPFASMIKHQPQFVYNQQCGAHSPVSNGYPSFNPISRNSLHPEPFTRENSISSSVSSVSTSPSEPFSLTLDYDKKRISGFKAMQNRISGQGYRYPTSTWSGYGISYTSPAPLNELHEARKVSTDEDVWTSPQRERTYPSPISSPVNLNSSNATERVPSSVINKITTTDWPDLTTLLVSIGLEKYIGLFASHEIDLITFPSITDKDLIEIGVTAFGARRKMLLAISELNKRAKPFSPAPGAERNRSSSSAIGNTSIRESI